VREVVGSVGHPNFTGEVTALNEDPFSVGEIPELFTSDAVIVPQE
jgi:hypothetical protein